MLFFITGESRIRTKTGLPNCSKEVYILGRGEIKKPNAHSRVSAAAFSSKKNNTQKRKKKEKRKDMFGKKDEAKNLGNND